MEPLVFEPWLRPMVWGGRVLGSQFNKKLPDDRTFGESWELSAHPQHVSRIAEGSLEGTSLTDLCASHSFELFGESAPDDGRFPLLIKLLDCHQLLSIQVHPTDELAPRLANEPLGKTEAWIILAVQPEGKVFAGLKPGVTRGDVEQHLENGTLAECLHSMKPKPGDCMFLPAGTVHAVGGGVVMAEVQQSSDATFRLFDWNRPGPDGKPRQLHIRESLESIDWKAGPVSPAVGRKIGEPGDPCRIAECRYFTIDRYTPRASFTPSRDGGLSIWMILDGTAELRTPRYRRTFGAGETVLVPAACDAYSWTPTSSQVPTMLGVRLP